MRSAPEPSSPKDHPQAGAGDSSASGPRTSRERALIMAALNQVDGPSTWTSRPIPPTDTPSGTVSPDAPTAAESSQPSAPASQALPGNDAFPGYEIRREIHRGGQGVVYLATQLNTRRRVAIKVMHGGATIGSTGKARFDREVHLLGQLNHPNIVKLHDSGSTSDGSLFYVMDYVSGRALDEVLREQRREARRDTAGRSRSRSRAEGAEDIESTLRFFAKVCDGVNAAHLKGVIHRDIKPANVRVDQNGEPVLVDFGLAKVTAGVETDLDPSNPMTMTGQFIGSLPWASPEQAVGSGDAIDLRSDVYSLGVMLYQMLTGGKFPYTVIGNMRDVLDNIQRAEPARPSTVRRQINNEIETIVLTALAKEKDRRYQSAGDLARDIRRYLNGEPIEAKRDAGWYVIRKTLNRHKFAVAFAATVGLLIIGGGIGMGGLWRQAEGARAVAVVERDRAEDNLDSVRDLANTFLYDFNDSIANLRGATKAREIVLEKALEYLALLSAQPDPGPRAMESLADAHERVGDLYGQLYGANTGTTEQAAHHYQQALAIRSALADANPGDMHHVSALARTWERIGENRFKHENFPGSLEAFAKGEELATRANDTPARLRIVTLIADVHRRIAVDEARDPQGFETRLDLAEQTYAEASEAWGRLNLPETPRRQAVLTSKTAQSLLLRGRASILYRDDPQGASVLIERGHALFLDAIADIERLREADPADYQLARDLWVIMHYLGQSRFEASRAMADAGRPDDAERLMLESLETFERLLVLATSLAMDQSNLEAQRDLGVTANKLGNALRELGRMERCREVFAENVALWQAIYRTDPVERHLRDLGVGQYKVAQVDEELAADAATPAEKNAQLRLARAGYQAALETFQEYGRRGGPAQGITGTVQSAIDRVDASLAGG